MLVFAYNHNNLEGMQPNQAVFHYLINAFDYIFLIIIASLNKHDLNLYRASNESDFYGWGRNCPKRSLDLHPHPHLCRCQPEKFTPSSWSFRYFGLDWVQTEFVTYTYFFLILTPYNLEFESIGCVEHPRNFKLFAHVTSVILL